MAPASPRRTQEERTAIAREKLAKAAFHLINKEGYASFRVAAVAKAAGVSQGGQQHHFPTKDSMALAAVEYGAKQAEANTRQHLAAFSENDDPVRAIAQDSKDYYFSASFEVALGVAKSSKSNPDLRREIARINRIYRDYAEQSWQEKLLNAGWSVQDAEDVIAMTTGLVRGLAIRQMIRRDQGEYNRLIERWTKMVHETIKPTQKS